MNIGNVLIYIAFFSSLGAALSYFRESRSPAQGNRLSSTGSRLYMTLLSAGLLASAVLFYALLTHQFQYSYVARYSSRSLPLLYLISAFWAGQEGTFLFWALLVSVLGLIFMRTTVAGRGYAMSVVSLFTAFLYLLLMVKSPFDITNTAPQDGSGLNPLLQDPWMAIHPPILFIGYAATVFPFALVVSSLLRKKYSDWHVSGFAWTAFAALTLGAGIIIGGFWAYKVLGWGGYWGWDPVENSSLVPWLLLLALIHGLLIQKTNGSLARTTMLFAIVSFIAVLYATFLTRSGVLADFSVHSFVDLGINNYLVGSLLVTIGVGIGLFVRRFRDITSPRIGSLGLNRETALLMSLYVLGAGALFTFAGMSSPLITGLIGKASQVDITFYNKVNLPVAIAIALLLGITPFLGWKEEPSTGLLKRLWLPLGLTALACMIAYVAGVSDPLMMLFAASSSFGLISNLVVAFRQYRSGLMSLGGPVAHIGVGLLLLGIIGSGSYDDSRKLLLKQGEPQSVFGYQFVFKGISDEHAVKPSMDIEVSDGKTSYLAAPKLYFSEYNQSTLREPDIKVLPLKDLYISPLEVKMEDRHADNPTYELTKGETKDIGGYQVNFVRFDMAPHGEPGEMAVGAVLNVRTQGADHEVVPRLTFNERGERKLVPAALPALHYPTNELSNPQISLSAISVEEKKVLLELLGTDMSGVEPTLPQLIVEISTKPLMMVVWTGVVLIIAGTAISLKRRTNESRA